MTEYIVIEQLVQLLGHGLGFLEFECRRRNRFLCFPQRPDRFRGSHRLLPNGHRWLSPDVRQPGREAVQCALLNAFIGWRGLTLTLRCSSLGLIRYSDNFLKLNYTIKYCKPIKLFCIDTNMSDNDTELHIDSHP